MQSPIFFSGPHGAGKTTLVNELLRRSNRFVENDFDINFIEEFADFETLGNFERCLVRLYHRIYQARYAECLTGRGADRCVIVSRSVYDSEAYVGVYRDLGWITEAQFERTRFILEHLDLMPRVVVLNPSPEVVLSRLQGRRVKQTRVKRDQVFRREDESSFVSALCKYFERYRAYPNVLYLEDNSPVDVDRVLDWSLGARNVVYSLAESTASAS